MRRSERAIEDRAVIDSVIRSCRVCRLGLSDGGEPYIVPLSFGYDGRALYFHGSPEGRKIDLLRKNSRVCFEFDIVEDVVEASRACGWGMAYQSVIGSGTAEIVEDSEAKREALEILMARYSSGRFSFPEKAVRHTCVIKVSIEKVSGKRSIRRAGDSGSNP